MLLRKPNHNKGEIATLGLKVRLEILSSKQVTSFCSIQQQGLYRHFFFFIVLHCNINVSFVVFVFPGFMVTQLYFKGRINSIS